VIGYLKNFGSPADYKKERSIFFIKTKRINTAPPWFEKFNM